MRMSRNIGFSLLALIDAAVIAVTVELFRHYAPRAFANRSDSLLTTAIDIVVLLALLYILEFYSPRRTTYIRYLVSCLALVILFDVVIMFSQYVIYFNLMYGRKMVLIVDVILLSWLHLRRVILSGLPEPEGVHVTIVSPDPTAPEHEIFTIEHPMVRFTGKTAITPSELEGVSTGENRCIIFRDVHDFSEDQFNHIVRLKMAGHRIYSYESFFEEYFEKVPVMSLSDEWFIIAEGFRRSTDSFYVRLKRLMDIALSSIGLIIASPLLLLSVIAVKLDSKGPAFFHQVRTGQNGEPFTIHKLRTMRLDAEKDGAKWATKNDSRITRVGAFMRKTRLDEIPQLFNVLRGDMSLIGPRPERPEFDRQLIEAIPYYPLRNLVKPGVTGWAQVNYPYGASIEDSRQKLMYDLYYAKNCSLFLDMRIILRTVRTVLFARGN